MVGPPQHVIDRRQALNEEAYFACLKALLARGQTDTSRTIKIRKELNISNHQHQGWVQQIRTAIASGPAALLAASLPGSAKGGVSKAGAKAQRGGSQALTQQRSLNKKNSKAATQQAAAQQEDARMVGYKVQYYLESRGQWQTGVITAYRPPNIIITFNLGEPGAFHETVKWESSPKLVMLQEIVDITPFNLQH